MNIDVFVMAAGKSSRFGSPKQLQVVNDVPMVLHAINKIKHKNVVRKTLVIGAYSEEIVKLLPTNIEHIFAEHWDQGLSASILAAVDHFDINASHLMIVLADQIAVSAEEFDCLIEKSIDNPLSIVAARYDGVKAVPAIFPKNTVSLLATFNGDKGAGSILNSEQDVISLEVESAGQDIDTPADLSRFQHKMSQPN